MKTWRHPFVLYVCPALLLWLAPGIRDPLLYDRTAILHGEWWRLWTGHWVHFSASHLAWNLAVLLGAGVWLERLQPGRLLHLALVAAPLISLALLVGEPAMQAYGGLSGLATGLVVLLALTQLGRRGQDRRWWCGLLVLVMVKIATDATQTEALFVGFGPQAVRSSALAHAAGAAAALALFLIHPARLRTDPAPQLAPLPPDP